MSNVESLTLKLNRLTAFNSLVMSLQAKGNTSPNATKKLVLEWASEVFPSDWRMYALKNTKAKDILLKLNDLCERTLLENTEAIRKLSLELDEELKNIEIRTKREETAERLHAVVASFLLTENYPARELECLYALIDSGEITTEEQLAEYGVVQVSAT